MLTKGLRDEENERINSVLKQLIALTFIPEDWNLDDLNNQLKFLALTMDDVLNFSSEALLQHLQKLHFDWENAEIFADFLIQISKQYPTHEVVLKQNAVTVYEYVQNESKTFSLDIFHKITSAKA